MNKDKMIEYMLINEKARYEAIKAITACFKHICITVIICLTIIAGLYIYFVVPVEEVKIDNGSKAVLHTTVDNGSNVWQ